MNWLVISITSVVIFICIALFVFLFNKNNTVKLLDKNINDLKDLINFNIFNYEEVWVQIGYYGDFKKQIRFELTKTLLLKKCNYVNTTICDMINLYNVDSKITKFYSEQVSKINNIITEIEKEIERLSTINNNKNYELTESEKVVFNKLNNKLNNQITSFLVGNAKYYTYLKFNMDKKNQLTFEEYNRKQKTKRIFLYIISLVISIGVGILVNYISKIIGI